MPPTIGGEALGDRLDVVVHMHGLDSFAVEYLFELLADPGDELLISTPSYPLFEHLARFRRSMPRTLQGVRPLRVERRG